jgi:hypothetical protein
MRLDADSLMEFSSWEPKTLTVPLNYTEHENAKYFSKNINANSASAATLCTKIENCLTFYNRI